MGVIDGDPFFTLTPGFKYIYNATEKTVDYYDDNGNKFYHRDDIKSIADLHIDYRVHKSHNFEIHIKAYSRKDGANILKSIYNPEY